MPTEQDIGILCRNGFMVEKYDEQFNDLIRTLTDKGIDEIKEILQLPEYRKLLTEMLRKETMGMSKSDKVGVIIEMGKILNGRNKSN